MSDDVADRAEAALAELRNHPHRPFGAAGNSYLAAAWRALELVPELVAELKTTRAQLEQRRIATVEQLKALKPRPDLINGVLIRAIGAPSFGAVFELNDDGTWNDFDATTPEGERTAPEDVPLPAFILWQPADAAEAVTDA